MAFTYETIVPWGRSFDEYQRMFALSKADFNKRIIGCGDGPASFNNNMTQQGKQVVSCDPLYHFTKTQIEERINATFDQVIGQTRKNQDQFIWSTISSVEELGQIRMDAMNTFLADYEKGKQDGRYIAAELPDLPFADATFDLALCSHFLFLYSDNLTLEFHQQAIETMCRVANEVRIFPILTYNSEPSPYLTHIIDHFTQKRFQASLETVPYEFQRGGNQVLKIYREH